MNFYDISISENTGNNVISSKRCNGLIAKKVYFSDVFSKALIGNFLVIMNI